MDKNEIIKPLGTMYSEGFRLLFISLLVHSRRRYTMSVQQPTVASASAHLPKGYDPQLYRIRHSLAHVLAQAVLERFPGTKIAIGPPT